MHFKLLKLYFFPVIGEHENYKQYFMLSDNGVHVPCESHLDEFLTFNS